MVVLPSRRGSAASWAIDVEFLPVRACAACERREQVASLAKMHRVLPADDVDLLKNLHIFAKLDWLRSAAGD
jgi:hypothetical protein